MNKKEKGICTGLQKRRSGGGFGVFRAGDQKLKFFWYFQKISTRSTIDRIIKYKQMTIAEKYLTGLKEHLSEDDQIFLSYATGATADQLAKLKQKYPNCPRSLLDVLGQINGTYWQKYGEHEIAVLILGSDVFEYPYYLKSVETNTRRKPPHTKYSRNIQEIL